MKGKKRENEKIDSSSLGSNSAKKRKNSDIVITIDSDDDSSQSTDPSPPKNKIQKTLSHFFKSTPSPSSYSPFSSSPLSSSLLSPFSSSNSSFSSSPSSSSSSSSSLSLNSPITTTTRTSSLMKTTTSSMKEKSNASQRVKFDGSGIYLNQLNDKKYPHVLSVQDILDLDHLTSAFFSTYSFDIAYLKKVFSPVVAKGRSCSITLAKHYFKNDEKPGTFMRTLDQKGQIPLCVIHPPLPSPYSNVHSKLWILSFDDYIRIVISSGNLTSFDWHCFTQVIWIQDFGLKTSTSQKSSAFENEICNFWETITKLPISWLKKYDFSTAKAHLISSVPGYHKGKDLDRYGHMKLRNILRNDQLFHTNQSLQSEPLYFQTSTIGSIDEKWCTEFCKSTGIVFSDTNLQVIFPTIQAVFNSTLGIKGGGMLHLKEKTYNSTKFPKRNLYDFESSQISQLKYLSHSKIMLHCKSEGNRIVGWLYVGSHNFSPAALGRLQKKETQLHILNYEMGVILPISLDQSFKESETECKDKKIQTSITINPVTHKPFINSSIPIPFAFPPIHYDKSDQPFIAEAFNDY